MMNLKIKFRESFRPFAPAVLDEQASEYFDLEPGIESPYMLLVADVQPELRVDDPHDHQRGADLRTWVNEVRSDDPGGHARRLLRAAPDRRRATAAPTSTPSSRRSTGSPAARS